MDELEISGKRYISTRRAAREHGYHSDYMGQLIRSGKVAGQKVGRAWYIEEESLAVYLGKAPHQPQPHAQPVSPATTQESGQEQETAPEPIHIKEEEPQTVEEKIEEPLAEQAAEVEVEQEPVIEEKIEEEEEASTPIRIHTPAPLVRHAIVEREVVPQSMGGLRYEHDDSPSLPIITRMPQAQAYTAPAQAAPYYYPAPAAAPLPPRTHGAGQSRFPFISLSVVGVLALLAAAFASNFVTATVVSKPGNAATVQYAIHW